MRIASSQDSKTLNEVKIYPTPANYDEGIELFRRTIAELTHDDKVTVCAGGIAGPLSGDKSKLLNAPHLKDWIDKPLKDDIHNITNSLVFVDNDTVVIGLGEARKGAGKNNKIVAYLTVSTGVGGARFVDGRIDESFIGFEPGHQIISISEDGYVYLEDVISGSALEKKYGQKPHHISNQNVWDEVERNLAVGLNNLVVFWSPEIIILGGGIILNDAIDMSKVEEEVKKALRIFPNPPKIVKSELGDMSGLYGAIELINLSLGKTILV